MDNSISLDRRGLIKSAGVAAAVTTTFSGLVAQQAEAAATGGNGAQLAPVASPYGPIAPAACQETGLNLLQLPQGFTYRSFSWQGDLMNDGQPVPRAHDGMACVLPSQFDYDQDDSSDEGDKKAAKDAKKNNTVYLIRNHEIGIERRMVVPGNDAAIYDAVGTIEQGAGGGCTVLKIKDGKLVDHRVAIGGTVVNCAGGASMWNTWLTCEETIETAPGGKKHGYVFDVHYDPSKTVAEPIRDMGRFSHEAVAFDKETGYVYMTEDSRNVCALYRFKPNSKKKAYLALHQGGKLQTAKVVGVDKANLLALAGAQPSHIAKVGQKLQIEWVDIDTPDSDPVLYVENEVGNPAPINGTVAGPFAQARAKGALRMSRGEGIHFWDGSLFITDTSFGYDSTNRPGRGTGCVWEYVPSRSNPERGTLKLLYSADLRIAGNNPDNITVSPNGGVLYMEDGDAVVDEFGPGNRLMGLTAKGLAYIFAKNNLVFSDADLAAIGRTGQLSAGDYRGNEFAGGTFSPDGTTLFVNIQTPGITFAIKGPWKLGNLK